MTIQTPAPTNISFMDQQVRNITALLTEAIESRVTFTVEEIAHRIASELCPSKDDLGRLHRMIADEFQIQIDKAGLMSPEVFEEVHPAGYDGWSEDFGHLICVEVSRGPSSWRNSYGDNRRMRELRTATTAAHTTISDLN